ncbi:MAG: PFL family protein [Clostridiales bacterium]|jgi:uncharacterized protein (UPF0210 family)|nr:PFL family protein [Clostridiales bacterium]
MFHVNEILQTIEMIKSRHLDIRTVTMGLSLFDCISDDKAKTAAKIYDKVCQRAGKLKAACDTLSARYGIPIINKRVSVSPISLVAASSRGFAEAALALDRAAKEISVDFIGGYSALVHKGMTDYERQFIMSLPHVLSVTDRVCASVNVASSKAGINMDAVRLMGEIIKEIARATADKKSVGCSKLVVFANAVEDNPFMAGAFNGIGENDCVINVGISGPGVVCGELESVKGKDFAEVSECIKRTAFKITRTGQLIAKEAAKLLGANFGIVDLSLAPTPAKGDSVARILEELGLESVGAHGTTAALALLNDAVKKGGVMAASYAGGLSGAFIPVSEDEGMIEAVRKGALSLEKLEAMTSVCSVGIDMVAVGGQTSAATIAAIIADEAAIGVVNNKTTAVRIIPVEGMTDGEVEYGGLFGTAPIMKTSPYKSDGFINRGGRIPPPIHSNKN